MGLAPYGHNEAQELVIITIVGAYKEVVNAQFLGHRPQEGLGLTLGLAKAPGVADDRDDLVSVEFGRVNKYLHRR